MESRMDAGQGQPVRHYAHHSYIWLGSLKSFVQAFIVILFAGISGLSSIVVEIMDQASSGKALDSGDLFVAAVVAIGFVGLVIVAFGLVVLFTWLSYRNFWYEIGPEEFSLYSGILNKKRVHVPYARVQSVDQHASLLQRLFGVCTVAIDTAGGAANKAIVVPYVTKEQAESLRNELYGRKYLATAAAEGFPVAGAAAGSAVPADAAVTPNGAASAYNAAAIASGSVEAQAGEASQAVAAAVAGSPALSAPAQNVAGNVLDEPAKFWNEMNGLFGGHDVVQQAPSYEYGLTNRELLLTGLSGGNNMALAFFAGLLTILGFVINAAFTLFEDELESVHLTAADVQALFAHWVVWIVLVVIVIVLVLRVLSAIGTCITFGGFKARRRGSRIEVERGLLQHQFQGIDVDRVQAVIVKQTFLRRLIGYGEISLSKIDAHSDSADTNANETKGTGAVIIHPFVKMSRVGEILAGIIPEYAHMPEEKVHVAKRALRRSVVRNVLWLGGGFWLLVCAAVVFPFAFWLFDPVSGPLVQEAIDEGVDVADTIALVGLVHDALPLIAAAVGALVVVLAVTDAIRGVLWWRQSEFGVNRRFMEITNGGFATETTLFERRKIQFGALKANPFQRIAGLSTLHAVTAAGIGGTAISIKDIDNEDADAWLRWVQPHGNADAESIANPT